MRQEKDSRNRLLILAHGTYRYFKGMNLPLWIQQIDM